MLGRRVWKCAEVFFSLPVPTVFALRMSPLIPGPRVDTSRTLSSVTRDRKSEYGTSTRGGPFGAVSETTIQLTISRPSRNHQKRRPPGGRRRGCEGRGAGGGG